MPSQPWQTKEWREKRKSFLEGKHCEWCGATERLVIHHTNYLNQDGSSISNERYLDWENTDVIVLCRKCHTNFHKGKVLCKECKEHWHDPKYKSCWNCFIQTSEGQDTVDRIVEEQYEDEVIEMINPLCGKSIKGSRWRFEYHSDVDGLCIVHCGESNSCDIYKKWRNGELKEEDTHDPQYFKEQKEFEEKLDQLTEQGMDFDEAVEKLLKEQTK